jgi:hypothetical protein
LDGQAVQSGPLVIIEFTICQSYNGGMLVVGEGFPYKQLSEVDKSAVYTYCGGSPVRDVQLLRAFMFAHGMPLLGEDLRPFMDNLAARSTDALGIDHPKGKIAFNRGVLLYAGVVNVVNNPRKMIYDPHVILDVGDADSRDFALEGLQTVRSEVSSFDELAQEVRPAMETEEDILHELALAGAGAMHIVMVRSVESYEKRLITSPEALTAAHPELADLPRFEDLQ